MAVSSMGQPKLQNPLVLRCKSCACVRRRAWVNVCVTNCFNSCMQRFAHFSYRRILCLPVARSSSSSSSREVDGEKLHIFSECGMGRRCVPFLRVPESASGTHAGPPRPSTPIRPCSFLMRWYVKKRGLVPPSVSRLGPLLLPLPPVSAAPRSQKPAEIPPPFSTSLRISSIFPRLYSVLPHSLCR